MYKLTDLYKQIKEEAANKQLQSKYKIYCDLDGVLVDFDKRFEEFSNGISPKQYESKYGITKFWELITDQGHEFWSNMEWMPEGRKLWDYIKKYKPSLLSAPSRESSSRYGKRLWVQNNIPGTPLILAKREAKQNYAGKNNILIDDRKDNCDEWVYAGGIAIMFTSTDQVINDLKQLGL